MGELVPIFLVTLLVTTGLVLALTFGRPPTYRPTRKTVLSLLNRVVEGTADSRLWDLFLGLPIQHDEFLESIRQQCVTMHEGLDGSAPAGEGLDGQIYDRAGREKIQTLAAKLEKQMSKDPILREF